MDNLNLSLLIPQLELADGSRNFYSVKKCERDGIGEGEN